MKRISLLFVALLTAMAVRAQSVAIKAPRLKVGVVMGGGGAKGAAHIGVLKYMEEMGIPVDYVAGTSMGSIIGGLYALGYTPDQLTQLISSLDWSEYIGNKIDRSTMSTEMRYRNSTTVVNVPFSLESLLDKDPSSTFISQLPSAYVNNSSLVNLFNDLCVGYQEEMDFNDMPIPFACVATDLISGNEVVLRSGSIPTAMRASMAIPGVFSPVPIGDKLLVDGGLVNNFPADVLREMGADIIIGIEITSTKDVTASDLQSLPQVFARLVTNSTNAKREENRELCNIYIIPDVSGYGMLSFNPEAIDTLVQRGYRKAGEFHAQLERVKAAVEASAGHSVGKVLHAPQAKNIAVDTVMVRSITINNVSSRLNRWLIRKGRLKVGQHYTQESIDRAMKIYRGTGCFDQITYHIKESDSLHRDRMLEGLYDLSVNMKPAMPNVVGLGLRYDTEEGAALLLNFGLNEKKFSGSKLNLSAKLSFNPRIGVTYTYAVPEIANFNASYQYRNEHFRVASIDNKGLNMRYYQHKISGYFSQFHLLDFSTRVGVSYTSTSYDLSSWEGSILDTLLFPNNRLLTPFVDLTYDNLDDSYFAKRGIKTSLTARYHFDLSPSAAALAIAEGPAGQYFYLNYDFQSYITPRNGRFTIIPQVYGMYVSGDPLYFNLYGIYGSEVPGRYFDTQMPFIGMTSVGGTLNNATVLRLDLRYNIFGKHYVTAMYNFMAHLQYLLYYQFSLKDAFDFNVQGAGLKYSYNSPVGPVSLTAHWSNTLVGRHFGLYFSFGYTF